jgi:integrase
MTVRKRKWCDAQGRQHEKWMIHVEHTWPDGRKETIRKVSPVQTKRGAEQFEREVRSQLVSGQRKETVKKVPTLAAFADEFLAYQATLNKPAVVDGKRMMLRLHLLPFFGKLRLDQIDERGLDAYTVEKLEHVTPRGVKMSPSTINQHLKLLGRMLRVARRWRVITEAPEIATLKQRKSEFDFLDFDEADAFLAGAVEHVPEWHPYLVVALRTGMRVGELIALRWREDVDIERGRIRVQQSWTRKNRVFQTTKNDKIRELPLTWDAVEALRTQRSRTSGDLVFSHEDGSVLDDHATAYAIEKLTKKLGMRLLSNHVLRHTFASHAVMRGVPIRQVQEWLGHGSIVVTMRYAHLTEGLGDNLIQRLAPAPAAGAARSQHMDSTRDGRPSKTPPHTPVGPLS